MDIGLPVRKFIAVPNDEPVRGPEPAVEPAVPKRHVAPPVRREKVKEPV